MEGDYASERLMAIIKRVEQEQRMKRILNKNKLKKPKWKTLSQIKEELNVERTDKL